MKAIVKVERLWMDNKIYRAGDVIDISEEQITRLGTSIKRDIPTVEKLDERDAQIDTLKAKIEELEIALAVASTQIEPVTDTAQKKTAPRRKTNTSR